jgi:hypothetical protein
MIKIPKNKCWEKILEGKRCRSKVMEEN